MTVVAVLEFRLRAETADDGRAVVHRILGETRAFEGCEGVDVVIDAEDPTHLLLVERWASPEADAAYRAFRAGPGAITDLGTYLAAAPSLTKGEIDPEI